MMLVVIANIDKAIIEKKITALLKNVPASTPFMMIRTEYWPMTRRVL